MDGVVTFRFANTRPLGPYRGDNYSQPAEYGGFGLSTINSSLLYLTSIALILIYMTIR